MSKSESGRSREGEGKKRRPGCQQRTDWRKEMWSHEACTSTPAWAGAATPRASSNSFPTASYGKRYIGTLVFYRRLANGERYHSGGLGKVVVVKSVCGHGAVGPELELTSTPKMPRHHCPKTTSRQLLMELVMESLMACLNHHPQPSWYALTRTRPPRQYQSRWSHLLGDSGGRSPSEIAGAFVSSNS